MSIYLNQSYITIQMDTDVDLSAATAAQINYTKPGGTTGSWTATTNGQNIEYEIQNGDLDESGVWLFQGEATIDGRSAVTRTVRQAVLERFR